MIKWIAKKLDRKKLVGNVKCSFRYRKSALYDAEVVTVVYYCYETRLFGIRFFDTETDTPWAADAFRRTDAYMNTVKPWVEGGNVCLHHYYLDGTSARVVDHVR